jgi:hypothetical protein
MIFTLHHVAVTFLGWLQLKKIYMSATFGPLYSKIVLRPSKKFPPCQVFHKNARTHPTPLHPIISISPFAKWGIDFM